jgi:hypothetical protein
MPEEIKEENKWVWNPAMGYYELPSGERKLPAEVLKLINKHFWELV